MSSKRRLFSGIIGLAIAAIVATLLLAGVLGNGRARGGAFGQFAGYLWHGPVSSVDGSWSVPRVLAGSPTAQASTWLGAQTQGPRHAFVQIGTNEQFGRGPDRSPAPLYYAFWSDTRLHFQPQPLFLVHAGDQVSAHLEVTGTRIVLSIRDATSGVRKHFSTNNDAGATLGLAEWVQEDPGGRAHAAQYPQLSVVRFRRIAVNSHVPAYPELYATWMSANGINYAPTPVVDGSFAIRQAVIDEAGGRYLRIAELTGSAEATFFARIVRAPDSMRYTQISRASPMLVRALRTNRRALATTHWPGTVQQLIDMLIADGGVLLSRTPPPRSTSRSALAMWQSAWSHAAKSVSRDDHMIRRALDVPEITY